MKRVQLEPWTTWEKMCLVNAVQKTGDQNWTAVSRVVKNIYDDSSIPLSLDPRPPHWTSMKQCAAQYESLLNQFLGSRRKKRTDRTSDPNESAPDIIQNFLRNELAEELEKKLEDFRLQYRKRTKRLKDLDNGVYDDQLEELLQEINNENDIKMKLKCKIGEKNAERNSGSPIKNYTIPNSVESDMKPASSSAAPLLTSLLQSPSQHSLPSSSISLLLNSAPSTPTNESPTLTKLLESPSSKVPVSARDLESRPQPSHLELSSNTPTLPKLQPTTINCEDEIKEEIEVKEEPMEVDSGEPVHANVKAEEPDTSNVEESEIIIEEAILHDEEKIKDIKKSEIEVIERVEVVEESVEDILERLKVAIISAVGENAVTDLEDVPVTEVKTEEIIHEEEETEVKEMENKTEVEVEEEEEEEEEEVEVKQEKVNSPENVIEEPESNKPDDSLNNDDQEENVQLDLLDQEAVEIIVMGSNSNSVINVLGQDSSSEDITQSSGLDEVKDSAAETADEEVKTDREESDETTRETRSEGEESRPMPETEDDDEDLEEVPVKEEEETSPVSVEEEEITLDEPATPLKNKEILETKSSKEPFPEVTVSLEQIEVPLLTASKDERKSPALEKMRKSRKRQSSQIDSKPNSPASTASTSYNDDEKEFRAWRKTILVVFSRIASHRFASIFSKPIADAAGYHSFIQMPMDLSTIKKKIETGIIRTTIEFQRDVLLMICNAIMYNPTDSVFYRMALEMWNDVIHEMNVMVQALGDGVPLGESSGEEAAPTRAGRQAKLSVDKRKSDAPSPSPAKRRRL